VILFNVQDGKDSWENETVLSIYGFAALVGLGRFFSFLIHTQTAGLLGRGISPSQGRYLHKQNKRTQTSMSQVGFEPTIPVFERAKMVDTLDSAATAMGRKQF
jgi:hypothetical protein